MIDKASAEHYSWGEGCDGWHLVRTPLVSVIEERMPAGASEIRHYHRSATQFFYVLEGTLSIEVEGTEYELGPRQGLSIAAGQAHQVFNRGTVEAEFLVVSNPPSHGDRVPA
ncbi:MAG TPA: cupin domain-containing protein [Bryobacteraceae bacterium]|jgi:mannose-6-phosphate isomerase-like protein (cupin superfamily)|nr:cupin domain-containing protein [Bryobacteraceae bacterium]